MSKTAARGVVVVAYRRGYVIREWSGPGVETGAVKPFSVEPSGTHNRSWFDTHAEAEAWVATAPTLRLVSATIEAYVPVAATEDEVEDWVKFNLHHSGSLSGDNPLVNHEFECHSVSVDDVRDVE